MDGLELKGDFEQRISGWSNSENKAPCLELGNTDRLKAQCQIWIAKKEMCSGEGKPRKKKNGRGEKSPTFACLCEGEVGPRNVEILESGSDSARRSINLANFSGGNGWRGENSEKECYSISDTGFNGGGICILSWLYRFADYLKSSHPRK